MGNSIPSDKHIQVRSNASITFKRVTDEEKIGGHREKWQVKYIIDKTVVRLDLDRVLDKDGIAKSLRLQFSYSGRRGAVIFFFIDKLENDQLEKVQIQKLGRFYDTKVANEIYDSWGFVTKTNAFFFGEGKGLVVVEEKSMYKGMNPYSVTVAHYYADCSLEYLGLSMILDISVSNNNLEVSLKGPVQHHSSSLFSMFQQVSRTRIWKRMPYVENQRRVIVGEFLNLNNELECESDSDSEENTNNLPPTQLHYSINTGRSLRGENTNNLSPAQPHYSMHNVTFLRDENVNNLSPTQLHYPRHDGRSLLSNQGANNHSLTQLHYSRHDGRSLLSNQGAVRGNNNGNIIWNQYNFRGE